jgi:hypothetical protein
MSDQQQEVEQQQQQSEQEQQQLKDREQQNVSKPVIEKKVLCK